MKTTLLIIELVIIAASFLAGVKLPPNKVMYAFWGFLAGVVGMIATFKFIK